MTAQLLDDAVAIDVRHGQFTYSLVVTRGLVTKTPPCGKWAQGRPVHGVLRDLEARGAAFVVLETADLWAAAMDLAGAGVSDDVGPLIASRYHGRCPACTGRWEPGDLIAFDEDESAWLHAECAA